MTDDSPRLKAAFRYMVYGQSDTLDVDRIIDMLQALEKFVAVKDSGDGSAFKVDGQRGGTYIGKGGDAIGTKKVAVDSSTDSVGSVNGFSTVSSTVDSTTTTFLTPTTTTTTATSGGGNDDITKEALKFLFSDDGYLLREFILEETCKFCHVILLSIVVLLIHYLIIVTVIDVIFLN